ncbi:hypothetical protein AGOR_G00156230 [Albula goreensis]|uniref:Coiled-coil domain-containing protein n=1 Tax=Albula goreensis TaxID=1534307 RepID=A0A8T3CZB4_9TELE|nr:hypothetical protein AGOR_G00156230 [Albula goreensis]
MMELDIDQSHLPRVQEAQTESPAVPVSVRHTPTESGAKELCQCFAVLEDGALAHSLQEQEIEQYYNSNVQKNQLVQNDIRIAKRLQDEEEQQLSQASRQLEEQDSEYARRIQEEIQRCAEEARRREEEDEEIAKQLQEEEMDIRRQRLDSGRHGDAGDFPLIEERTIVPDQPRPRRSMHASPSRTPSLSSDSSFSEEEGETCLPPTRRGRSVSNTDSDCAEPLSPVQQNNSVPQQVARQGDALRLIRNLLRESLGPAFNVDDEVFLRPPSMPANRLQKRLNTAPSGHQGLNSHTQEWENRIIHHNVRGSGREGEGWEPRVTGSRRDGSREERWRSNEGYNNNEVRAQDRIYSWTYRESGGARERHVHFQDERRHYNSYHGGSRRETAAGSYQNNFGDRGVVARRSCHGDFRQARRSGIRGNHNEHRSGEDHIHSQGQVLQRSSSTRRSYHGDCRDRRRDSNRDDRRLQWPREENTQSEYWTRYCDNLTIQEDRVYQQSNSHNARARQKHSSGLQGDWRECDVRPHRNRQGREEGVCQGDRRVRRSASERWQAYDELEPSSEEEEERGWRDERRRRERGRREERPQREVRRSVSFSSSLQPPRAGHRGAGAGSRRDGACLELGELEQVLRDEELARMLQEEEEHFLGKNPPSSRGPHSYSKADFRAAQVAQDEEIARFMQRQEKRSQRRSCELETQGSRREHRDPGDPHETRSNRERRMELPQMPRERLDSEGLNSPGEDFSPECQSPSPTCTSLPQAMRNVAEELDPTFKAKRRESNSADQTLSGLSSSPSSHSGLHDYPQEPTFVPPTKRQSEKSGRHKAKEKKESCKQQ